jgi:hypothetical protein
MQILTFKYEKDDGTVTDRVFMPLIKPNKMYEGFDLSELTDEEIGEFVGRYNHIYDYFLSKIDNLKEEFDVKHSYRRFNPDKMKELEIDAI